jgi:hypothetical protein
MFLAAVVPAVSLILLVGFSMPFLEKRRFG